MVALLIVFGVVVVSLILVMIYRGTLQIHEEDHILIDDKTRSMTNEQSALFERIAKVSRVIKVLGVVSGVLFLVIAGLYISQILKTF